MKTIKELSRFCSDSQIGMTYIRQPDGHYFLLEGYDNIGGKFYTKGKEEDLCQTISQAIIGIEHIKFLLKRQNLLLSKNTLSN